MHCLRWLVTGLALLGVALYGDKVATNGEPGK